MIRIIFFLLTIFIAYGLTVFIRYLFKNIDTKIFNFLWILITFLLLGIVFLNTNLV